MECKAIIMVLRQSMLKNYWILLKNKEFLEKSAEALVEKETLLFSDIRRIKESTAITVVTL